MSKNAYKNRGRVAGLRAAKLAAHNRKVNELAWIKRELKNGILPKSVEENFIRKEQQLERELGN